MFVWVGCTKQWEDQDGLFLVRRFFPISRSLQRMLFVRLRRLCFVITRSECQSSGPLNACKSRSGLTLLRYKTSPVDYSVFLFFAVTIFERHSHTHSLIYPYCVYRNKLNIFLYHLLSSLTSSASLSESVFVYQQSTILLLGHWLHESFFVVDIESVSTSGYLTSRRNGNRTNEK